MTKYDFRIRRGVFRSGKIKTQRDFQRFEKDYKSRKQSNIRLRNLIILIVIIIVTTILLFTIHGLSATKTPYHPEQKIESLNQIL